jgi:hypothetical protein
MKTDSALDRFRPLENFHIVLWLVKDLCWCTVSKNLGLIMILPTLALAIYLTYLHRKTKSELLHNTAIVFWIGANSTWMIGEFFFNDSLRNWALLFFFAGLATIFYYYLTEFYTKVRNRKKLL